MSKWYFIALAVIAVASVVGNTYEQREQAQVKVACIHEHGNWSNNQCTFPVRH